MASKQPDSSEYSRDNVERYHKRAASKGARKSFALALAILLVVVLGGTAFAAASWYKSLNDRLQGTIVDDEELQAVLSDDEQEADPTDPYYVLLLGTDGRAGEEDFRADTIILVRVDPPKKQLTMLSIPRDTHVYYKGSEMKINAAHFYDGPAGMITAVQDLTGVKISHYAEVNFDGLADITDALGGVWVDVDQYMYDDENFNHIVSLDPGYQRLNGEAALFYCRCRQFYDGDYTRMRHQREFIKAIIKQVLDNPDPLTLFNVVDKCADMVTTDLSAAEIIALASEFRGIDVENSIYTAHAPSFAAMLGEVSYVFVSQWQLDEMMEIIDRGDDPGPYLEDLVVDISSMPAQPVTYEEPDYSETDYYYDDTEYYDETEYYDDTDYTDYTDDAGDTGDGGYDDSGSYDGGGESSTDGGGGEDSGE